MRWIVGLISLLPAAGLQAAPATQVAWTKETLALVEGGDPQRGKELAKTCASCHGETGVGLSPAFPNLAGQLATYLYRQLRDYKDGSRQNPIMQGLAAGLSDQDMADLAAFYSRQAPAEPAGKAGDFQAVLALIEHGDSKRILPPCRVCHGENGQGERIDTPRLAGQPQAYLEQTLRAYRDGSRHNDVYGRMREIAKQLSDEEIQRLAAYYANLAPTSRVSLAPRLPTTETTALALLDFQGQPRRLSEWRGKKIVLNFWSSGCQECLIELPQLGEIQKRYGDTGIQVVGVGLDDPQKLANVVRSLDLPYPILLSPPEQSAFLLRQWGDPSAAVPFTVLIEPDGRIAFRHIGRLEAEDLAELIAHPPASGLDNALAAY